MEFSFTIIYGAYIVRQDKSRRPFGFCVDIGAPSSGIGKEQLNRVLAASVEHSRTITQSHRRFRFADTTLESLGRVKIPLWTLPGAPTIVIDSYIVAADVPALLGMDVLDRALLVPDTVMNRLEKMTSSEGRAVSMSTLMTVSYVRVEISATMRISTWTSLLRYTSPRLSCQTYIGSSSIRPLIICLTSYGVRDRTIPHRRCCASDFLNDCCQRILTAAVSFRVSFGAEDVRFNERVFIDIIYIDVSPVLHMVDEGTRFNAASFLSNASTSAVCSAMLKCWATLYTG